MNPTQIKTLFTVAALFNFSIAALLLLIPGLFLELMQITPAINSSIWVQEFAGLVLVFGIGYYWVSRDPYGNRNIISLGIIGKCLVPAIGLWNILAGEVSWQFMIPASADAVFALLFYRALGALKL